MTHVNSVVSPFYECSCEVCWEVHVGETGTSLGERVEEHAKSIKRGTRNQPLVNTRSRVDTGWIVSP